MDGAARRADHRAARITDGASPTPSAPGTRVVTVGVAGSTTANRGVARAPGRPCRRLHATRMTPAAGLIDRWYPLLRTPGRRAEPPVSLASPDLRRRPFGRSARVKDPCRWFDTAFLPRDPDNRPTSSPARRPLAMVRMCSPGEVRACRTPPVPRRSPAAYRADRLITFVLILAFSY
jgi:hypothetical protein